VRKLAWGWDGWAQLMEESRLAELVLLGLHEQDLSGQQTAV